MINPAILHLQNPQLAGFGGASQGTPRSGFQLPVLISPSASPTDQTLFEEPQDATKKHYLPRYDIAAVSGGAGMVKWVSLEPSQNGFQLIVHLAEVTDPSVVTGNIRQDATTRYLLTANLQGRVASWDLTATATEGAALKLILALSSFADRDAVHYAMTDQAAQAKLIVRRSLALALPVTSPPPPPGPTSVPGPAIAMVARPFPPVPGPPAPPAPAQPLYRQATVAIDSAISFTFDKDLDKNVFEQLGGVASALPAWNIRLINWNGRPYKYYQDSSQRSQIYFLPDAFKIGRQAKPPHYPNLIVSANGDDEESVTLTLTYLACPVWDPHRIDAATDELRRQLSLDTAPTLAVLVASDASLSLTLPSDDPLKPIGLVPQSGAIIDTSAGIKGSVTLKLPQFRQVYQALFDDLGVLLSGQVAVTVDKDVEKIPFAARASDFVGDIFDVKMTIDGPSNSLVVVLQNAIESSIRVDRLMAALTRDGQVLPNSMAEISPGLPADLAPPNPGPPPVPGSSLTVTLHAAPGQALDTSCSARFDFSHTSVVPDSNAIWHAIMQNQVVGPVARQIIFKLWPSVLTPASSADAIKAVQVEFENGQTASFNASLTAGADGFLIQKVPLAVPIEAYVLGEGSNETYQYRLNLITSGAPKTGVWVTDKKPEVYLSVG